MSSPEITGRILYTFQSSWPTVRNVSIALFVALCAVRGGSALAPDGDGLSSPGEPMPARPTVALPSTGSADDLHRGVFPECVGGSGDCCIDNGTPGCNDSACCETVCFVDPFCCDTAGGGFWDSICAGHAFDLCGGLCGGVPIGACCDGGGFCIETDQFDCENIILGIYLGDGTFCVPESARLQ